MSYSLKNSVSSPGAPVPDAVAANVGAVTVTSAVGTPATSRSAASGSPANWANVPGASVTGWSWSSAEVSVYDVGAPAAGVANEALPAATFDGSPTSASLPDRYSFCSPPTGYDGARAYAWVASPLYWIQSRK